MVNLTNVIKVTQEQYEKLVGGGSISKGGVTYTYDANAMYLVDGSETVRYRHNIQLVLSTTFIATFSIITSSSAALKVDTLKEALYNNGFTSASRVCPAQGQYYISGKTSLVIGVYCGSATGNLGFKYITIASTSNGTMTVNQTVSASATTTTSVPAIYDVVEAM